ncbi:hypothetical protein OXX80_004679 [Metschnikowia pulcherrima]
MPQIYSPSMNGSFFSPNPGLNASRKFYGSPSSTNDLNATHSFESDPFGDSIAQGPMGAKTSAVYLQTPASNLSFDFSPDSPKLPQGSPAFYTPQTNLNNLHDHGAPWSTDKPFGDHHLTVNASQLSFQGPNTPSIPTLDPFLKEFDLLSDPEMGIASESTAHDAQHTNYGLGIVHNAIPAHPYNDNEYHQSPQKAKSSQKEDHNNNEIELFLKEDTFKDPENVLIPNCVINECLYAPNELSKHEQSSSEREVAAGEEAQTLGQHQPARKILVGSKAKAGSFAPRKLKKAKSFGPGSQKHLPNTNFSLDNCLNEFHVQEGTFLFEDETARVSKRVGSPAIRRRKSAPKLSHSVQSTKKSQASCSLRPTKCLKPTEGNPGDIKSGLVSFQVQLGPGGSPCSSENLFTQNLESHRLSPQWLGESEQ